MPTTLDDSPLIEITTRKGKRGVRLHLHRGQLRAMDSLARFIFIIAGTQSGKTSFGPWWLSREIRTCGPGDYLAVTATYDLFKLKMLPEMLYVFTQLEQGWTYHKSERVLEKIDRRIILRSADALGGLESATAKAAWLDECGQDRFVIDAWEAIQRRIALYQGRVLGTTTPYNLGWLKQQVFDRWRAGDRTYHVIQFASTMNPRFPCAEYERAKATLPAWKFEMFYNGNFSRPAGMIYGDFSDVENTCRPFPIPKSWPRYVGLDFGPDNTALIWIAYDAGKDIYYLYRETLEGGLTTPEHAAKALVLSLEENVVRWTGGAPSEKQYRMDWNEAGVPVNAPTIAEVDPGIDRVIALIKSRRLKVFDTCTGVLDEIGRYSRKLDAAGQPTQEIKDKERYHRLDGLRYDVIGITTGGLDVF